MNKNITYFSSLAIFTFIASLHAQISLTRIADYSTPVPGAPGTTFAEIGQPFVHHGQVLFYATNNAGMPGLYLYDGSALQKVADTNTPSPGGGRLTNFVSYAYALENGAVAFTAYDTNGPALFLWTNQVLTRLIKNGDPIPGTATNQFSFFGQPAFDHGTLYFIGMDSTNYRGVHRYDGMVSTALVSSLEFYPGTALPHSFSAQLAVESHRAAFWSATTNQNAIFTWADGVKNFLVSSNDTIPGTSENFSNFQSPPDLQGGLVAFKGGSAANSQEGIFLCSITGGEILPVVRRGDPNAGLSGTLTSFGEMALDNGRVWFQAGGTGGQSLFLWESNRYTRLLSGGMVLDGPSTIFSSAPFTFNQNSVHQGVAALVVRFSNNTKALYLATEIPPPSTLIAATNLVGTSTPIPGGTGNFLALGSAIPWRGGVLFTGQGTGGQFGLYHYLDGNISVILNQTTFFPGTSHTVANLQIRAVDPARLAIYAVSAGGDWGLLIYDGTTFTKVADNNTAIPGGAFGTFSSFSRAQFTGSGLTFHGTGSDNYSGVFEFNNGTLSTLVDSTRIFPETTDSLGIVSFARQGDLLALIGQAGTNYQQTALMLFSNQVLTVVATNGLALSDRTNRFYNSFYSLGFAGGELYFSALVSGVGFGKTYVFKVAGGELAPQVVVDENTAFPGIVGRPTLGSVFIEPTGLFVTAANGSQVGLFHYTAGGMEPLFLNNAMLSGASVASLSPVTGGLSTEGLAFSANTSMGQMIISAAPATSLPAGGRFAQGSLAYSPGNGFCLTFAEGTPGAGYRLQYRGLERDAVWTTLTNFTYNGPTTLCDSTATNQARIYRMISP